MTRENATWETPLLNSIDTYIPEVIRTVDDDTNQVFDTDAYIHQDLIHCTWEKFDEIFSATMHYFTTIEIVTYQQAQKGVKPWEMFKRECVGFLRKFPEMNDQNDLEVMLKRIGTAVYGYYITQPLIDNENTSDIKICAPDDVRVRVKGKAYQSNVHFIDENDLLRFVEGLAIRNKISYDKEPVVTFTDDHDANYKLRFTVSLPIVNAVDYPYLHIRKIPKNKPDFDELIRRGMLDEKIKTYLIEQAKSAHGIVFAGPPGSGKTTALNAIIEYIPRTRETLVIQENDELFTNQPGFMFKHVTHGLQGEPRYTLEDLGRIALVEGCNEFIIGEAKGGEMRSIATLLNSGGYGMTTIHSNSAKEIPEKMADLIKYGSSYSYEEAKRMIKVFKVLVYMEDYKVREILEIDHYDEEKRDFVYRYIYRYGA